LNYILKNYILLYIYIYYLCMYIYIQTHVYKWIIENVVENVKKDFSSMGVEESILQEFQRVRFKDTRYIF